MRILYGVSSIGLGHASRAAAVAPELERRGAEVVFVSSGQAADFLRSYGLDVREAAWAPVPEVKGGRMVRPWLWYLRYWLAYRKGREEAGRVLESVKPDLVVGDEEFSSLACAVERGKRSVMIADELNLGFARSFLSSVVERRVERWYRWLQSSVTSILMPDFGEDRGKVRHVSPIVRGVTKQRREVLAELGVGRGGFVLFSMSGSGIGEVFLREALEAFMDSGLGCHFVVSGNRGRRLEGERVIDLGFVRDNQNLVAAADLVISTAGKSTIDEAASYGTPVIAIPILGHAEQERNAAEIGYRFEDLGRMRELIVEKFGRRSEPRRYRGAELAAEAICSLAVSVSP